MRLFFVGGPRGLCRAYATAQRQLAAWHNTRPLDDAGLAAYIGHLRATGRAKATATMAVTAARRAARDAGQQPPGRPLTRQALEDFRGTEVAAARRGQTPGLTADECAAILVSTVTEICVVCPAGHTTQYDQCRVMTSDRQRSTIVPGVAGIGATASLT